MTVKNGFVIANFQTRSTIIYIFQGISMKQIKKSITGHDYLFGDHGNGNLY